MYFAATALAQDPGSNPAAAVGFDPMSLLPFVLIIVVFYFLIFRPQQKRMKQQKEMLSSLRRGDKIVTTGGIFGTVSRIENDQEVHVEVASGVVIRLNRASVSDILTKTNVTSQGAESSSESVKSTSASQSAPKSQAASKSSDSQSQQAKPAAKKSPAAVAKKPLKK
jgi:preprotein translocase subunit YajC